MNGACERRPSAPARLVPGTRQPSLRRIVQLTREEVLETCGRLVLAHRALVAIGASDAASDVATVFELLERRVSI